MYSTGNVKRYQTWPISYNISSQEDVRFEPENIQVNIIIAQVITEKRTNGAAEAWNLIVKKIDHPHPQRPDVFLKEHHDVLRGKQLFFADNLCKKDQKHVTVRASSQYNNNS